MRFSTESFLPAFAGAILHENNAFGTKLMHTKMPLESSTLPAPDGGSCAGQSTEQACEMALVGKAAGHGNLADFERRLLFQQGHRVLDALLQPPLMRRQTHRRAERPRKMSSRKSQDGGHFCKRYVVAKIRSQQIHCTSFLPRRESTRSRKSRFKAAGLLDEVGDHGIENVIRKKHACARWMFQCGQ